MPGKVKVRIVSARGLPVMDRSSDLADAFAEVKLGNSVYKTEVCKKSLNPVWNSDWYRFEVDDGELQEETLQLRVMDYDTYTAHDAIGKTHPQLQSLQQQVYLEKMHRQDLRLQVNISLNCLLSYDSPSSLSGWFPIYDTMHGIRGEIKITVKVDFFVDANKFRQSSCGVQFFTTPSIPSCYKTVAFHGFVEELVVNDDPEYQWIDNFRTPRSSNEARQRLFQKLSGELQRKLGLKVIDLGGNAVTGYQQYFDLEGESGIVVRGIGTCVYLRKLYGTSSPSTPTGFAASPRDDLGRPEVSSADPAKSFPPSVVRKRRTSSTDSDGGSPFKECGGSGEKGSLGTSLGSSMMPRHTIARQRTIEEFEFPFFTLTKFPYGFLRSIGGVVSARSVKLLDRINNPDEPETRDSWWREIRIEIRSHAKALGCHAVVAYSESTTICEELIVLSATGTAACVDFEVDNKAITRHSKNETETDSNPSQSATAPIHLSITPTDDVVAQTHNGCSICHIPYMDNDVPIPVHLTKCLVCRQGKVPDMLFSTTELPPDISINGKGCLLQGRVCRSRRKEKGEANAELISNILPFIEYELHRQLTNKLKLKGMNALFGLHIQVSVGEVMIIAVGTATAVYLSCLPPAPLLRVSGKMSTTDEEKRLKDIQKKILEFSAKSRASSGISEESLLANNLQQSESASNDTLDEKAVLDPLSGNREAFVIEIDDQQDEDVITYLFDAPSPEGLYCGTTEFVPGVEKTEQKMQMITAVKRIAVSDENVNDQYKFVLKLFDSIFKSFWFKVRRLSPCSISNIRFDLEIPMADSVQVAVSAYVIGFKENQTGKLTSETPRGKKIEGKHVPGLLKIGKLKDSDDLQFEIDEESQNLRKKKACYKEHAEYRLENRVAFKPGGFHTFRPVVELTPMSCVVGCCIERYIGNINLFFIRESLSVRENGGLNHFIQLFIGEVHAIVRAQVLALGGNALTSFRMNKMVLLDSPHKNQGQILLNVCGDVVEVNVKKEH